MDFVIAIAGLETSRTNKINSFMVQIDEHAAFEAFSNVVLFRFDPLLRRLCEALQSYNKTQATEVKLRRLLLISDVLDILQAQLNSLRNSDIEQKKISMAIYVISDYLTLPLRAILRSVSKWDSIKTGDTDTPSNAGCSPALQSAIWKCVERASRSLQIAVELSQDLQMDPAKLGLYLAACADAIPTHDSAERLSSSDHLDKGEPCLECIYGLTEVIVKLSQMEEFTTDLVRLLDIAVTLLEPPSDKEFKDKSLRIQSLAASFISVLLDQIKSVDEWKKVFPATYAAIYRRILQATRQSNKHQATQVAVECIGCLTKLLCITLASSSNRVVESVAARLKALSNAANNKHDAGPLDVGLEKKFEIEARKRLPPTLHILSDFLSGYQSPALKISFLKLCHAILVDSVELESEGSLQRKMLESVLVCLHDDDPGIQDTAKAIVSAYKGINNVNSTELVGPRIVDLIENVSILAQGSHGTRLEESLKLIQAYLSILDADKQLRTASRALLASETFTNLLRRTFLLLYDLDFHQTQSESLIIVLSHPTADQPIKYRYLQDGQAPIVDSTLVAIGRLLGRKHTVLIMDSCFNALITTLHSSRNRLSLIGQRQIQWLHEWIGFFRYLRQLWIGASLAKHSYIRKLALTIIPILVTSRVWALPSYADRSQQTHSTTFCLSAIHGNTVFTKLMLGFIGDLIQELDDMALQSLVPTLLPHLLEKSQASVAKEIQSVSDHVLQVLASSLGYKDLASMLIGTMESSFIPYIMSLLRLAGGQSVSNQNCFNVDVKSSLEMACVVFQHCMQGDGTIVPLTLIPALHGLIAVLSCRFDHMNTMLGEDEFVCLLFVRFFKLSIILCRSLRKSSCSTFHLRDNDNDSTKDNEPWFDLLKPFESTDLDSQCAPSTTIDMSVDDQARLIVAFKGDTAFIGRMAWRLGYLMSHQNLQVQRITFDSLEVSFRYLGWIALVCGQLTVEETNGPKTAILRQIHGSWTTIQARMNATCESVSVSLFCTSLTPFHPPSGHNNYCAKPYSNVPEQRYVLASLFTLVATMCEAADDFMASRWRPAVWPCLRKIIEGCTERLGIGRKDDGTNHQLHQLQESEYQLFLSALDCIHRVYRHRPTGVALAGLIPTIGSCLLPLLDNIHKVELNDKVAETLESLICIDGDALYRPLVELTCGTLQPFSWVPVVDRGGESSVQGEPKPCSKAWMLRQICESQPEQDIW